MQKALLPWQQRFGFQLEVVDIGDDEELERRYGEKVPVLTCDDQEVCHYFLDESALNARLGEAVNAAMSPAGDPL